MLLVDLELHSLVFFNMHDNGVSMIEGDNREERDNDRRDEESEEQKATKEYYERSVELERLRCKYYYSPFKLLAYDINCIFLNIGAKKKKQLAHRGRWTDFELVGVLIIKECNYQSVLASLFCCCLLTILLHN